MSGPKLKITHTLSTLPQCTPQLMPFHVNYTGHAPISTFFRVRKAPSSQPGKPSRLDSLKTRLLAAFRGRTIHGLDVPVLDGYCGVVLRSDSSTKSGSSSQPQAGSQNTKSVGRRPTRRTRGKKVADEMDRNVEEGSASMMMADPEAETLEGSDVAHEKSLFASHTFSSVVFWNADIAVDEGKDEYIRALDEWISLSSELHRTEE